MANAKFTIEGTPSADRGFDALSGATVQLQLEDQPSLDVYKCRYYVGKTLNGSLAPTFSGGGLASPPNGAVTMTLGPGVWSYEIVCEVNDGVDINTGRKVPAYYFSRIVAVRSIGTGTRKIIPGETTEYDPVDGWTSAVNDYVVGSPLATSDLHVTGFLTVDNYAILNGGVESPTVTTSAVNSDNSTLTLRAGGVDGVTINDTGAAAFGQTIDAVGIVTAGEFAVSPAIVETRTVSTAAHFDVAQYDYVNGIYTALSAGSNLIRWPLPLPHGATVTSVSIVVDPAAGHGALPVKPTVVLKRHSDAGVTTTLVNVTDPSATVPAYEAVHTVTATVPGGHLVDRSVNHYSLEFTNEAGGSALSGLRVLSAKVTLSRVKPHEMA